MKSEELKYKWWRATRKFNEKFFRNLVKTSSCVDALKMSQRHGGPKFWNEERVVIALMLLRGRAPPRFSEEHQKKLSDMYRYWFARGESLWGKPAVLFDYDFVLRKFCDLFELDKDKALVSPTTQVMKKLEPFWNTICV